MDSNADNAVAMFSEGYNCAQSVLACCGGPLGLSRDIALRVAGPFGAGMGRMGETCGAVSGAFMVIGLKYARTGPNEDASKEKGYELVQQFARRFKDRHGSISCRELLGCDLGTPEGKQQAARSNLFTTLCPRLVRSAAEIVEELLSTVVPSNGRRTS
jgi:C_GCAxxG_C_C family probable redox protein